MKKSAVAAARYRTLSNDTPQPFPLSRSSSRRGFRQNGLSGFVATLADGLHGFVSSALAPPVRTPLFGRTLFDYDAQAQRDEAIAMEETISAWRAIFGSKRTTFGAWASATKRRTVCVHGFVRAHPCKIPISLLDRRFWAATWPKFVTPNKLVVYCGPSWRADD